MGTNLDPPALARFPAALGRQGGARLTSEQSPLSDPLAAKDADSDAEETKEWLEALEAMIANSGRERGLFVLKRLEEHARDLGIKTRVSPYSAYQNTIPLEQQAVHPGDIALEERIMAIVRWNALAMVVRANKAYGELGGMSRAMPQRQRYSRPDSIISFAARERSFGSDLVFFQPHSAPGVYARAFLEGRLSEEQLAIYRQEVPGNGLCSYPHPWLMPEFWQFPTGSMGIGPITSIYQARFMRYLAARRLADTSGSACLGCVRRWRNG